MMRLSCNGCRVLRKGCGDACSIRPCLQWIKSGEAQANATLFLAKFYGRAGLLNLVAAAPSDALRPAVFRSLLYEACGRIVNPVYGAVGLLWSGTWHMCQAAVEAVLKGAPIKDAAATGAAAAAYDIRHVFPRDAVQSISKDDTGRDSRLLVHNNNNKQVPSSRCRPKLLKRTSSASSSPSSKKTKTTTTTTTQNQSPHLAAASPDTEHHHSDQEEEHAAVRQPSNSNANSRRRRASHSSDDCEEQHAAVGQSSDDCEQDRHSAASEEAASHVSQAEAEAEAEQQPPSMDLDLTLGLLTPPPAGCRHGGGGGGGGSSAAVDEHEPARAIIGFRFL